MPIEVRRGDVTTADVDAVVNAANERLAPGGGVCGAIHAAAGPALAVACRAAAPCPVGEARLTPGFGLRAPWVIHAVGPVWAGGAHGEAALLASCYRASLRLARAHGLRRIAFPAISTGIYGYPREAACRVAVDAVGRELADGGDLDVLLVAWDEATEAALRAALPAAPGPVPPEGDPP